MDGLRLTLENSPDTEVQSRFYNGWTNDHYITNVFVFSPDGTIGAISINRPGCIHNSTMCKMGRVYTKYEKLYEKFSVQGVVDSAFTSKNVEHFIRSAKPPPATRVPEDIVIYS